MENLFTNSKDTIFKVNQGEMKGEYIQGKFLGGGGFGRCYALLEKKQKKEKCAVKILLNETLASAEIDHHKNFNSDENNKNIVKLFDSFKKNEKYYIFMELCELGSLKDFLKKMKEKGELTLKIIKRMIKQIINGLEHIHDKRYAHGDIKLENILVSNDNGDIILKLADFGCVKTTGDDSKKGTEIYMSPELFHNRMRNDEREVDVWALGVVIYFMLTSPSCEENKKVIEKLKVEKKNLKLEYFPEIKSRIKENLGLGDSDLEKKELENGMRLIQDVLNQNYGGRKTELGYLKDHEFLKSENDSKILMSDCKFRKDEEDVKKSKFKIFFQNVKKFFSVILFS